MLFIKCMSLFHNFVNLISVPKYTSYLEIVIEVQVQNTGLRSVSSAAHLRGLWVQILLCVVQIQASAMGQSLIQGSPAKCVCVSQL